LHFQQKKHLDALQADMLKSEMKRKTANHGPDHPEGERVQLRGAGGDKPGPRNAHSRWGKKEV